ncbi:MAG: acetyl-CoA hydrolase/transferase family protein [Bacillota bacterium]
MSIYMEQYSKKQALPEEAVKVIKSGDWVDYGLLTAQAFALDEALARRKDELRDVNIWTVLTLYPPKVLEADPNGETFTWNSWHFSGLDRKMAGRGTPVYYSPMRYSELPRYIRENIEPIDVSIRQVAPMDNHGYFNFGPQNSHSRAVCEKAKTVIVEVNQNQPRCLGGYDEAIHISEVDYIVESSNPVLPELSAPEPTDADRKIAGLVLSQMEDGCCIQLGIGSLPNAVGKMIADSDLKNLGCHTEMLADSYVDMFEAGKLTGRRKSTDPGKIVYSFALGTRRLYDFIHDNPVCAIYPVDYTNNPGIAARNERLITINNAVEVDMYGQVCSESDGTRHISGTGGQLDFVLAAYQSRGGKSFICLPSCYRCKDGKMKSRIVPTLAQGAIVTDPRTVAQYIVTEYGMFNLKGKTTWQRAEGLINLSHPDFREELIKSAETQGIWRRSNKK